MKDLVELGVTLLGIFTVVTLIVAMNMIMFSLMLSIFHGVFG